MNNKRLWATMIGFTVVAATLFGLTIGFDRTPVLGLDLERLNVNGGAIAFGHPLAATGVRATLSALLELRRRKLKRAIVTACAGGGQGMALLLETA